MLRAEPFRAKAQWEAAGRASSLSHASPWLHSGLFTDPHYFPSPWLVKSNLAPRYQPDKTALGSAAPLGGPGAFQLSSLPLRAGSRLSGQVPAPISSLFCKRAGILISRAVNYLHGHPVPSCPPCSCPRLCPVWGPAADGGTRLSQIPVLAARVDLLAPCLFLGHQGARLSVRPSLCPCSKQCFKPKTSPCTALALWHRVQAVAVELR